MKADSFLQAQREEEDRRYVLAFAHSGTVTTEFCLSLLRLVEGEGEHDRPVRILHMDSGPNLAPTFNRLVDLSLRTSGTPPWLLLVDTDVLFAPDVPRRLLDMGERFVEAAFAEFGHGAASGTIGSHQPLGHEARALGELPPIVEVAFAATAMTLVHREVLLAIDPPWFGYDESGTRISDIDQYFSRKARAAGFPPKMATRVRVGHTKLATAWLRDDGDVKFSRSPLDDGVMFSHLSGGTDSAL